MSTALYLLGKIPGITRLEKRGHKRLRGHLEHERGDADVLGIIKTSHGWELEPLDMVGTGEERYAVPVDEDEPTAYPADGLPEEPQTLLGTPIAVGYRNYGAATDVPRFDPGEATDTSPPRSSVSAAAVKTLVPGTPAGFTLTGGAEAVDPDDEVSVPGVDDDLADADDDDDTTAGDRLRSGLRWVAGWPGRRYRGTKRWLGRRYRNHKTRQYAKGWRWTRAGENALVIQQDGDSAWYVEPATYYTPDSTDVVWNGFKGRRGSRFDARGHGGEPETVHGGVSLATAYGPVIKLLAPVSCRIARNLHNVKLDPRPVSPAHNAAHRVGGGAEAGDTGADDEPSAETDATANGAASGDAAADGGQPVADAIQVEERALVALEDIKLIEDEMSTQEYTQTRVEQTLTKANPPGGELIEKGLKIGLVIVAGLIGAVVFDPGFLVQLVEQVATAGVAT
jgi:hypothetical protein